MVEVIRVPYLGQAESEVLLQAWLVEEGESVRRGQVLVVLDTLKASFEIEAERDGVLLKQCFPAGQKVDLQAALFVLGDKGEVVGEEELALLLAAHTRTGLANDQAAPKTAEAKQGASGGQGAIAIAPLARKRARELGVELTSISGSGRSGMIRVEDVERSALVRTDKLSTDQKRRPTGLLEPDFVAYLRSEALQFSRLSSEFKLSLYRRHGASIGADVRLGYESVLIAETLILEDGVVFAESCRVESETFHAGRLSHVGPRCTFRCRAVELGENAYFASDVDVGGGGAMDPEAQLRIGSHGFVGEHVHLNPARAIEIGDEVVISRNAVLMTHSFGQSVLMGYPSRFAGLQIGDNVQIGIAAVLFPGSDMGTGSILLSGSSLVTSVPDGRLFAGVPAKDMKAARRELAAEELRELARGLTLEFVRQLELRDFKVEQESCDIGMSFVVHAEHGRHRLVFRDVLVVDADGDADKETGTCVEEIHMVLHADDEVFAAAGVAIAAIDLSVPRITGHLGPLGLALREFLRKRGIRLKPRSWTYRGGWL